MVCFVRVAYVVRELRGCVERSRGSGEVAGWVRWVRGVGWVGVVGGVGGVGRVGGVLWGVWLVVVVVVVVVVGVVVGVGVVVVTASCEALIPSIYIMHYPCTCPCP